MGNVNYLEDPAVVIFDSDGNVKRNSETIGNLVRLEGDEKKIPYYDAEKGFHKISNPGWIIFDLREPKPISYIRFLLWDNCGSGKKQPSRRRYLYRLLIADDVSVSESNCKELKWEVVYDTLYNGSNGWQEFFFESSPRQIRYIKLYFINNSRDQYTHLVNIQAYEYPTLQLYNYSKGISDEWESKRRKSVLGKRRKVKEKTMEMAQPIHGLINNRIIVGDQPGNLECGISLNIYEQVSLMIEQITNATSETELTHIKSDIAERLKELHTIDKELQCFQHSIYYPVIRDMKRQRVRLRVITLCSSLALAISILQCMFDMKTLLSAPAVHHWLQNLYLFIKEFATNWA